MKKFIITLLTSIFLATGCATKTTQELSLIQENSSNSQSGHSTQRPISLGEIPSAVASERQPPPWAQSTIMSADGPYPVHLRDVPVAEFDPFNKLARGWGATGPKRISKPISEEEADLLRKEALSMLPSDNIQIMTPTDTLSRAPAAAGIQFDSLDINDCCGSEGANVPPDPELAVGPNHIIAVVNVAFEIYDKSGILLSGPTTFSSFFSGTPGCTNTAVFDPNVLYDEEADRFILGVDGNGTDYCIAAADGPDPTGMWNRYGFATNIGRAFFDYPHAGVGIDAIFMGSNQFGGTIPQQFEGRVFAIDKDALYNGTALTVLSESTGFFGDTPQPMNLHGFLQGSWPLTGPHYIVTDFYDGTTYSIWSWDDPFGANIFTMVGDMDLNSATGITAGFPIDVPQSGSNAKIQANDWRTLDAEFRNDTIWITNTMSCNPGGGTVDCIRWAQIDPTVPTVLQAGVFSSDGEYRTFPDLAVNDCGDLAIGYTKSSNNIFPSIYVTGRENSDPPGSLQTESELKAGEIAYTAFDAPPHRWGDYTGMTIDPDGLTYWYLGEYSKNTGNPNGRWGTHIGSFNYASCGGGEPPGPEFILENPIPGIAGVTNEWDVSGATPNANQLLLAGRAGTATVNVPGCSGGVTVDIINPRVFGQTRANTLGDATFTRRVRTRLSGKTLLFQAIDQSSCEASNSISHTFQ